MAEKLRYTLEGRVTDVETFTVLAKRAVQEVESTEPGTLAYEWFASDEGHFFIHAVYANDDAFLSHFKTRSDTGWLDEFLACCEIDAVWMLTEPKKAETRAIAEQFGGVQFHGLGGVVR